MRTMENEKLRVQISDHGAELSSIYDKAADREAVWIGDPAFWNRHAPVLFPFVGKVNGGFYTHKGVKYPMGQHGFARDNEFGCIENTANKTVHRLVSTEETKKVYPFDFAFTVTQELSGRTLTITWKVENTGDDDMYFSVGGHPAFMIPEQYDIVFNKGLENHTETELEYVLIDPETAGEKEKEVIRDHLAQGYRLTNEKLTLLHNAEAFKAIEDSSYSLDRELQRLIGKRAGDFFEYAISEENDCLVCSTYFRKLLKDNGIDFDNFQFTKKEELLISFGRALAKDPKNIPDEIYTELKEEFTEEEIVVITAMGVLMVANNYFNDILKVEV